MARRRGPLLWLSVAFLANAAAAVLAALILWTIETSGEASAISAAAVAAMVKTLALSTGLTILLSPLLLYAVWKLFDLQVLRGLAELAVEVRAIAHGERPAVDGSRYGDLDPLPDALNTLAGRLTEIRTQFGNKVEEATAKTEEHASRLGAILHEIHQGILVCNLKHQVVLYNQQALELLHVSGQVGLGRSVFGMLSREPVMHSFEMLMHRPAAAERGAPFLAGTSDAKTLLQGRMSLIKARGEVTGYVLTFDDVTEQVNALARRESLLRDLIDGVRVPLARLRRSLPAEDSVLQETATISTAISTALLGYRSAQKGWWPMSDIHSNDLMDFILRRLRDEGLTLTMVGLPVWLHGDSHTLSLLLEALIRRIQADTGITRFDVGADREGDKPWLEITWNGMPVPDETIEAWLGAAVSPILGGMAVRDVLQHHGSDAPLQTTLDGFTRLRLPMPPGRAAEQQAALPADIRSERPQFFDFDLLKQDADHTAELGLTPLRAVTYVVFDTETTGLHPEGGDQIVSIAGVRIVNGRILTGESFNRIVHPGRLIPPESVKFHGITDDMVQDKPPLCVVLPQFKAFCADAVLVGHNVAFDLKFLRMKERSCGVVFDNPALDTMLLSAYVDDSNRNQTLDAIADRYGVHAADRHTALGDSLTTAAVLLRLIDALEARGLRSFDDAVKTLNITQQLQQRQAAFSGKGDQAGISF